MLRTLSQRAIAAESACRGVARVGHTSGAATRQSQAQGGVRVGVWVGGWGCGGGRGRRREQQPRSLWCTVHFHWPEARPPGAELAVRCLLTAGWAAVRRAQALAWRAGNPSDCTTSSTAHPGAYVAALTSQLDAEQGREASTAGSSRLPTRTAMPPPPELATPVADSLRAWSRASEALLRREARPHAATPVQPSTTPSSPCLVPSAPLSTLVTPLHTRTPFTSPLHPPCTHSALCTHPALCTSACCPSVGVAARARAE